MDIDKWLAGLDNPQRADVLKTHIAETEKTKRTLADSSSYQDNKLYRTAWFAAVLFLVTGIAALTINSLSVDEKELKKAQICAEHPAACPQQTTTTTKVGPPQ